MYAVNLGVLGLETPTHSRHSSHLLALWAKEQREDFGLVWTDGEERKKEETTPGWQGEATAEGLALKDSWQPLARAPCSLDPSQLLPHLGVSWRGRGWEAFLSHPPQLGRLPLFFLELGSLGSVLVGGPF